MVENHPSMVFHVHQGMLELIQFFMVFLYHHIIMLFSLLVSMRFDFHHKILEFLDIIILFDSHATIVLNLLQSILFHVHHRTLEYCETQSILLFKSHV